MSHGNRTLLSLLLAVIGFGTCAIAVIGAAGFDILMFVWLAPVGLAVCMLGVVIAPPRAKGVPLFATFACGIVTLLIGLSVFGNEALLRQFF